MCLGNTRSRPRGSHGEEVALLLSPWLRHVDGMAVVTSGLEWNGTFYMGMLSGWS